MIKVVKTEDDTYEVSMPSRCHVVVSPMLDKGLTIWTMDLLGMHVQPKQRMQIDKWELAALQALLTQVMQDLGSARPPKRPRSKKGIPFTSRNADASYTREMLSKKAIERRVRKKS